MVSTALCDCMQGGGCVRDGVCVCTGVLIEHRLACGMMA